jgi:hypothetical protein
MSKRKELSATERQLAWQKEVIRSEYKELQKERATTISPRKGAGR